MRTLPVLIAFALIAGCASEEESTAPGEIADDERARGFSVSIPREVERIEVEVHAESRQMTSLRVEVEREDRSDLAEERFAVSGSNATRTLEANVSGMNTTWVLVVAEGGDVTARVTVRGFTAANETMTLRAETLHIAFGAPRQSSQTTAGDSNATP